MNFTDFLSTFDYKQQSCTRLFRHENMRSLKRSMTLTYVSGTFSISVSQQNITKHEYLKCDPNRHVNQIMNCVQNISD